MRGGHFDPHKYLIWDKVVLNLIGNVDFNPSLLNVLTWDKTAQRIIGDVLAYVGDLRAVGFLRRIILEGSQVSYFITRVFRDLRCIQK